MKLTTEKNELIEEAFHESFHGRTGAPMGHRFQSWNAGSFLLAYQAIRKGSRLYLARRPHDGQRT
jgi:hypothetical protein